MFAVLATQILWYATKITINDNSLIDIGTSGLSLPPVIQRIQCWQGTCYLGIRRCHVGRAVSSDRNAIAPPLTVCCNMEFRKPGNFNSFQETVTLYPLRYFLCMNLNEWRNNAKICKDKPIKYIKVSSYFPFGYLVIMWPCPIQSEWAIQSLHI